LFSTKNDRKDDFFCKKLRTISPASLGTEHSAGTLAVVNRFVVSTESTNLQIYNHLVASKADQFGTSIWDHSYDSGFEEGKNDKNGFFGGMFKGGGSGQSPAPTFNKGFMGVHIAASPNIPAQKYYFFLFKYHLCTSVLY